MAESAAPALTPAAALRRDAEQSAGALPPLLAEAHRLAATVIFGAHGRRRPGTGETFWQYRRANPGDPLHAVDWRRSARGDVLFVRETEWEAAQTVWIWCDRSQAMAYRSSDRSPDKARRAAVIGLALAILLIRGGERVALLGGRAAKPGTGELQIGRIAAALSDPLDPDDFGTPPPLDAPRGGRIIYLSDFFGDEAALASAMAAAASHGLTGLMVQVVDPAEESFPFDGRVVFESMGGALEYETDRAAALREDYKAALAARRARFADRAAAAGWRQTVHRTDHSAAPALLWLAQGLSGAYGAGGSR